MPARGSHSPPPLHVFCASGLRMLHGGRDVGECHLAEGGNRARDPQIQCHLHSGVAIEMTREYENFELTVAAIAQLGECQTEDLKVPSSILDVGSIDKLACDRGTLGQEGRP